MFVCLFLVSLSVWCSLLVWGLFPCLRLLCCVSLWRLVWGVLCVFVASGLCFFLGVVFLILCVVFLIVSVFVRLSSLVACGLCLPFAPEFAFLFWHVRIVSPLVATKVRDVPPSYCFWSYYGFLFFF